MSESFETFAALAGSGGRRVPVVRRLMLDGETAVSAFHKLHRGPWGALLESVEGGERWARYSFLMTEPAEVVRHHDGRTEQWSAGAGWRREPGDPDPFALLAHRLRGQPPVTVPGLPPFLGGAIGFLGWDCVRALERLPEPPADERELPDAVLMFAERVLILDNLHHSAWIVATPWVPEDPSRQALEQAWAEANTGSEAWVARLQAATTLPALRPAATAPTEAPSPYTGDRFLADVERIREYITAGDAFQVVLSRRLDLGAADPFTSYRMLRTLNPAPYLYFLHCDDLHVAGASPEVLVRADAGQVTVRPIAGTRPRGACPEEDAGLEAELRADAKEQAEHLMLVDLGRNDVGRVARYGSVQVPQFMVVERYSRVMHLVSEVTGELREDLDALDALAACFPAGTVSGAPKVRAMEIIHELEPTRRGPYAGAVGHVSWGAQALDTAIAIRTAVFHRGHASVQAGAGIVADSVPEAELRETAHKARAVELAVAQARAVVP